LKLGDYLCGARAKHARHKRVMYENIRSNKSTLKIVNGSAATVLR
jgi:ABC-type microcin C transport system permease subunit YejB